MDKDKDKNRKKTTIEGLTGDAILQTPKKIKIGGKTYEIAKPTVATVIRISELVSELTDAKVESDDKGSKILSYILENAKDCKVLGEIIATLICGYHKKQTIVKTFFHGIIRYRINPIKRLSDKILEEMSSEEMNMAVARLLGTQQLAFFFSTIISLKEKNLIKPTKKKEEKTES